MLWGWLPGKSLRKPERPTGRATPPPPPPAFTNQQHPGAPWWKPLNWGHKKVPEKCFCQTGWVGRTQKPKSWPPTHQVPPTHRCPGKKPPVYVPPQHACMPWTPSLHFWDSVSQRHKGDYVQRCSPLSSSKLNTRNNVCVQQQEMVIYHTRVSSSEYPAGIKNNVYKN